jgi:uncharacterized delta-60 repeat protein
MLPAASSSLTASSRPDIALEFPAGSVAADGGSLKLPVTASGAIADQVFTVRNPGGADLKGLTIVLDGPDASEFFVAEAPASVLPGGSTSFTLRHVPVTTGSKTVSLHLASNVTGSKNPFDLTLHMVPGTPDRTFAPLSDQTWCLAVQGNGMILTGGVEGLVRFTPQGDSDTTFFAPPLSGGGIDCIAVQKDGRILLGGTFTRAGGRPRPGLARFYPDGTVDETFLPAITPGVSCIAILPDGKVLAGGPFISAGGTPRYLVRLREDGSLDPGFQALPNEAVYCLALQPDGKILAGGRFTSMKSTAATRIARLQPDGTPETIAAGFTADVYCLAVQTDGRILAGGIFPGGLARLLPDGSMDASLTLTPDNGLYDLVLQADGKCLMTGGFTHFGGLPRNRIARIHADGSLDVDFDPNANATSRGLAVQADGKVLVSGAFTEVGGFPRRLLARMDNDQAKTRLTTEGLSSVRWLRAGTAPEVSDVTFELKPLDSPDWVPLGPGHRTTGGWELTGLTLPASGSIRALGRTGNSVMETVTPILTAIEYWRQQYFGTAANTGDAEDSADPDHDGLTNFSEFAFGLSPVDRGSSLLPGFVNTGGLFVASFSAPAGAQNILYSAEWSSNLLPGTWTAIPDTGTGGKHVFTAPGGEERIFVRYKVKMR